MRPSTLAELAAEHGMRGAGRERLRQLHGVRRDVRRGLRRAAAARGPGPPRRRDGRRRRGRRRGVHRAGGLPARTTASGSVRPSRSSSCCSTRRGAASLRTGVEIGWMVAADRTLDPADAVEQARLAVRHAGKGVVSFGLANDELLGPPGPLRRGLRHRPRRRPALDPPRRRARRAPQRRRRPRAARRRPHPARRPRRRAGGPGRSAWPTAGCASTCARRRTCCSPVVPSLEEHPLPQLLDAGVRLSINADDPLLFGPGLLEEYELCRDGLRSRRPRAGPHRRRLHRVRRSLPEHQGRGTQRHRRMARGGCRSEPRPGAQVKPAPFTYLDPPTLDGVLAALAEHGDDAAVISGGQSLVPLMNLRLARPDVVVDPRRVPGLRDIAVTADAVVVGAMVTASELLEDPAVATVLPGLAQAVACIGHSQIRNRTTIGGSVAHADPSAELPAVLVGVDGEVVLASVRGRAPGRCRRPLRRLVQHHPPPRRARHRGPLPRPVRAPAAGTRCAVGPATSPWPGCSRPCASTAGVVAGARLALSGVADRPVRATRPKAALVGRRLDRRRSPHCAERARSPSCDPPDDIHASGRHRAALAATLVAPPAPPPGALTRTVRFAPARHPNDLVSHHARPHRTVFVTVDGTERSLAVEGRTLLSDALRHGLGLTGTHVACEQGACGACTVVRRRPAGAVVPRARRPGRRRRHRDHRGGRPPTGALHAVQEALHDRPRSAVRLLHPGHRDVARGRHRPGRRCRRGPRRGPGRAPLPVHRLREHPGRGGRGLVVVGTHRPSGRPRRRRARDLRRPASPPVRGPSAAHRSADASPTTSSCPACCTPPSSAPRSPTASCAGLDTSELDEPVGRGARSGRADGARPPGAMPVVWHMPGEFQHDRPDRRRPGSASSGKPVGVVVADDRYRAEDAVDRILVDVDELPAVVDARAALGAGRAAALPRPRRQRACAGSTSGDTAEHTDAVFAAADRTLSFRLDIGRVTGAPMEPRGVVAVARRRRPAHRVDLDPGAPRRARHARRRHAASPSTASGWSPPTSAVASA